MSLGGVEAGLQHRHAVAVVVDPDSALGEGSRARGAFLLRGAPQPDHPGGARHLSGRPRPPTRCQAVVHLVDQLVGDLACDVLGQSGHLQDHQSCGPGGDGRTGHERVQSGLSEQVARGGDPIAHRVGREAQGQRELLPRGVGDPRSCRGRPQHRRGPPGCRDQCRRGSCSGPRRTGLPGCCDHHLTGARPSGGVSGSRPICQRLTFMRMSAAGTIRQARQRTGQGLACWEPEQVPHVLPERCVPPVQRRPQWVLVAPPGSQEPLEPRVECNASMVGRVGRSDRGRLGAVRVGRNGSGQLGRGRRGRRSSGLARRVSVGRPGLG